MRHPRSPIPHPTLTLVRHGGGYVALAQHRAGDGAITVDWTRLENAPDGQTGAEAALLDAAIAQALARARYPGPDGRYAGRAHAVVVGDAALDASAAVQRALAVSNTL